MTHSLCIAFLIYSAAVAGLAIWGEHYTPYREYLGHDLGRVGAYILGTLAFLVPTVAEALLFHFYPPPEAPVLWTLGALLLNIFVAGSTTKAAYMFDRSHKADLYQNVAGAYHDAAHSD